MSFLGGVEWKNVVQHVLRFQRRGTHVAKPELKQVGTLQSGPVLTFMESTGFPVKSIEENPGDQGDPGDLHAVCIGMNNYPLTVYRLYRDYNKPW